MHYARHMGMQSSYGVALRAWLDLPGSPTVTAFADRIGVTRVYLSQLAAGLNDRQPSPTLCVVIERESQGAVKRWDLRPDDWHLIWPELVGSKGAPKVKPAKAEA